MPELPEVETIRRQLEKEVLKKKIASIETKGASKIIKRIAPATLRAHSVGKTVTGINRVGKNLIIVLSDSFAMVIHLGMSGQLLFKPKPKKSKSAKEAPSKKEETKHLHLKINFSDSTSLEFHDARTFGEIYTTPMESLDESLGKLGHDPLESPLRWFEFAQMLQNSRSPLKALLLDQNVVAGIGNIYADEILFAAGLRYDREPSSLSAQEIRRLYRSIGEVLGEAVRLRGSTLSDGTYKDIYGKPGEYQFHHMVYAREDKQCKRCRGLITKAKFQGRSTYFCPLCQR